MTGILLIAHGSRQAEANEDLEHVAEQLRGQGHAIVVASYLELAQPDMMEGGAKCVEQGAQRVIMVPYFLSAGVHVRRDLTQAQQSLSSKYPGVDFHLAEAMRRHPLLVQIIADRIEELS
mgnify:CR=1 FL=1